MKSYTFKTTTKPVSLAKKAKESQPSAIAIQNLSGYPVYVGGEDVTKDNAFVLKTGDSLMVKDHPCDVYLFSQQDNLSVKVLETLP